MTSHLPVSILNTHLDESIRRKFHLFDFIGAKISKLLGMDMVFIDELVKVGLCFFDLLVHKLVNVERDFIWRNDWHIILILYWLSQICHSVGQNSANHGSIDK